MDKHTLVAALCAQRDATLRRLATLPDSAWDAPTPAPPVPPGVVRLEQPERRIRDLVAHLVVVDELIMQAGPVRSWMSLRRLGSSGTWNPQRIEALTALSLTELVTTLHDRGERFARLAAVAPAAVNHVPVRGPFGRQPLLSVVQRRVVHEWVHERDMAAAQGGVPSDPSRSVGQVIADAVLSGLPSATLPHVPLTGGVVRLVVALGTDTDGPATRAWGVDFGRRQYGPRVLVPADATIRLSAMTLGLLAHGRARVDDDGLDVRLEGAVGPARALLDHITMLPTHAGLSVARGSLAAR